jgi:UDP-N-acetylmuramate-alanine ligase
LVKAIEKKGMGDGRWGTVTYLPRIQKIEEKILSELRVGDVFVSLGAGDVTHIGRRIAKALKKKFK